MDVLFTGSIPKEYHYAVFSNDFVTLYDRPSGYNNTLPYYRIYFNSPGFYYSQGSTTFSSYQVTNFQDIEVTDSWYYRKDASSILFFTFVITLGTIFIVNLFTSIFKKGGLFGV